MLHTEPRIPDALARLVDAGVDRVIGIVLAPQYSSLIMGGYNRAVEGAIAERGIAIPVSVAGAWHDVPGWIDSLAERVQETIDSAGDLPIVFTAHSLPKAVVERDTGYLDQIHETIRTVAGRVGLRDDQWQFGYQSAGHTPEEWLTPDFKDLVPDLARAGHTGVIFVPVQFIADHLETLYDIDIAGREEAEEVGLAFHRVPVPNTAPTFIDALRQVVDREVAADRVARGPAGQRQGVPSAYGRDAGAGRPPHRGNDLRRVRDPDRAAAQPDRRGRGQRQLRDRDRHRRLRPRPHRAAGS